MREKLEFLVLQHVPYERMGIYAQVAEKRGINLCVLELWRTSSLPRRVETKLYEYNGLVVMGGPMSTYDSPQKFPTKNLEIDLIKSLLKAGTPILGVCLGAQLLAEVLKAKVYPNIIYGERVEENGLGEVELTNAGQREWLLRNLPSPLDAYQWHGDIFDKPKAAIRLATSAVCETQAFSYKRRKLLAYGMLFHLEPTAEMLEEWSERGFRGDRQIQIERSGRILFNNFISIAEAAAGI